MNKLKLIAIFALLSLLANAQTAKVLPSGYKMKISTFYIEIVQLKDGKELKAVLPEGRYTVNEDDMSIQFPIDNRGLINGKVIIVVKDIRINAIATNGILATAVVTKGDETVGNFSVKDSIFTLNTFYPSGKLNTEDIGRIITDDFFSKKVYNEDGTIALFSDEKMHIVKEYFYTNGILSYIRVNNENTHEKSYSDASGKELSRDKKQELGLTYDFTGSDPDTQIMDTTKTIEVSSDTGSYLLPDISPVVSRKFAEPLDFVEHIPSYPGGEDALHKFLKNNLKYPAGMEDITGRVVLKFVVESDGSISHVEVLMSLDPKLDEEAVRVVEMMSKWTPGLQDGQPVAVNYLLPVTFKLSK